MGGSGKSVTAAAVVRDSDVREMFRKVCYIPVGQEPKIRGIGEFGWHSWLIFCRDLGATLRPSDKCLSGYCSWRKKQEAGASSGVKVD